MLRTVSLLVLLLTLPGARAYAGADDLLHMPIGDPARKSRDVSIVLDAIVDTRTGDQLAPDDLADRLANVKLLLVGESHTAIEAHRVEARVIDLLAKHGRHVIVGVEMYPYTEQRWLDAWNEGLVTEAGFLHLSHWYRYWGFPWQYYRDVFVSARNSDAEMIALNAPIEVVRAVRDRGLASLAREEAAHIPSKVDVDSPDQMALFKASFGAGDSIHGGSSEAMWKRMLSAQATWDATMAFNAVKALEAAKTDDSAIVVVIAGAGHVEYGVGIERQAAQWYHGQVATLIPVPVKQHGEQSVRASYADFVWGIPSELYPAYPDLGLATGDDSKVLQVLPNSPAANAGLKAGDLLVSIDGMAVDDDEAFNTVMATKRWGDTAKILVKRGDETVSVRAEFRRLTPNVVLARKEP